MILRLQDNSFLWLRSARGATIEVLAGCLWITESGSFADRFVHRGGRYRVPDDGPVLIGSEARNGPAAEMRITASSDAMEAPALRVG